VRVEAVDEEKELLLLSVLLQALHGGAKDLWRLKILSRGAGLIGQVLGIIGAGPNWRIWGVRAPPPLSRDEGHSAVEIASCPDPCH